MSENSISFNRADFKKLHPFCLVVDRDLAVVDMGKTLARLAATSSQKRTTIHDLFRISSPKNIDEFKQFTENADHQVELAFREGDKPVLRGGLILNQENDHLIFILTPVLTNASELEKFELSKNDFGPYDATSNLMFLIDMNTLKYKDEKKKSDEALENLKYVQDIMVQKEKMASLGQLVSGVAHEVNTPLGISITVVSLIKTLYKKIRHNFDQGSLDEEDFVLFLNEVEEGSILLERNLNNAAALIRSFKKISVDQHADDLINIGVNAYIHDILKSIETTFKGTQISVEFAPGEEQLVNTYPGILTQILSNLFNNSHMHGFDNGTIPGKIRLRTTSLDENTVKIEYQDDGKGMSEDTLKNIFDPFFTTNRGSGGSGLGMNIVYNLVKHQLESELTISSKENEGMKFEFTLHELEKANV